MSKFFFRGESSSGEETEESDNEIVAPQKAVNIKPFQFSDEEEKEEKRVVKSAKEKHEDDLKDIIKQFKNHKKIKDMSKLCSDFEDFQKCYVKSKGVIDVNGHPPLMFIKFLIELEDFVNSVWEDKKSLSKNNSKSLASLRQKLRKYNKNYEDLIIQIRENIQDGQEDIHDEQNSENESEVEDNINVIDEARDRDVVDACEEFDAKEKTARKASVEKDADNELSNWSDTYEEDSILSDDDDEEDGEKNLASKFLKKETDVVEKDKKEKKKKEPKALVEKRPGLTKDENDNSAGVWSDVKTAGMLKQREKIKLFSVEDGVSRCDFLLKLNEIINVRGRKTVDIKEQIEYFDEMIKLHKSFNLDVPVLCKILFNKVSAFFDYNSSINNFMKPDNWSECLKCIDTLITLLSENPQIIVGQRVGEESENLLPNNLDSEDKSVKLQHCILSIYEVADQEFIKILQNADPYSNEYLEKLKNEKTMCSLIDSLIIYIKQHGTSNELCRIYYKKLEHTYYKFDNEAKIELAERKAKVFEKNETGDLLLFDELCNYIYVNDENKRLIVKCMLLQIYYYSLHDNYFAARDLLLMSHFQDNITLTDIATMILYNRAMVQLGLCAFRMNRIKDAHNALLDIQSSGRVKELLAQGIIPSNPRDAYEKTREQEKVEKARQMPFHMHINLELMEYIYLVCAMCIEVPYIALGEAEKRRMHSKKFYYQLRQSERQHLVGPPDTARDYIFAACKAMLHGDWKKCCSNILNLKMKTKVWDLFPNPTETCNILEKKIKEESLRSFLYTYSRIYNSISLTYLCQHFELEAETVNMIVSKIILNEELMASLDEVNNCIIMHKTEPSSIQSLAFMFTEKIAQFTDSNDRYQECKLTSVPTGFNLTSSNRTNNFFLKS